jgi:CheY-like chemotaxis protein
VLIVDDNADSATSLKMLAESWGHDVAAASDGPSALALAADFKPEYALIDIGLPGMDGYELARQLRKDARYGKPYLVALTGYGREQDRESARTAGFDEHMIKPANLDSLARMLAK